MLNNKYIQRSARTLNFLKDRTPGKVLITNANNGVPILDLYWLKRLMESPLEDYLNQKAVSQGSDFVLSQLRSKNNKTFDFDDDTVPTFEVFFSVGGTSAMMSGKSPIFVSDTGWYEPSLHDITKFKDLTFDPDNPWVRFDVMVAEDLINKWEGDFALMPAFHRSPLDAANGLRGDDLFLDMYDHEEDVIRLVEACADWSLSLENYLNETLCFPDGLRRGAWGLALPDKAVIVNGDPVDLISAEQQQKFDRFSCEKLFTNTGGGFFHHHALGIRQAGNVALTEGILIQNIYTDPGLALPAVSIIEDEDLCERIIEASLKTPIHMNGDFYPIIDKLLPILKQGSFILKHENIENLPLLLDKLEPLR